MHPAKELDDLGQSLWLENITRGLLASELNSVNGINRREYVWN